MTGRVPLCPTLSLAKNNARTIYQNLIPEIRPNISSIHTRHSIRFFFSPCPPTTKKRNENCVCGFRDQSVTKRRSRDIARGFLWVIVFQIWRSLTAKSLSDRRVCGCIAPPKCKNLRLILCVGVGLSKLQFTM